MADGQVGRPTKKTPMIEALILDKVREAGSKAAAYGAARIHKDTLNEWLANDLDFAERFEEARAQFRLTCIESIKSSTSWQSKAWLLERIFPEEFGQPDRRQLGQPEDVGGRIPQAVAVMIQNMLVQTGPQALPSPAMRVIVDGDVIDAPANDDARSLLDLIPR